MRESKCTRFVLTEDPPMDTPLRGRFPALAVSKLPFHMIVSIVSEGVTTLLGTSSELHFGGA